VPYDPTPYDAALDAMLEAGIPRGRADELLHAVWEQGRIYPKHPDGCQKCPSTSLHDLLGHDALGHKMANTLAAGSIYTPETLKSRGLEWVLDFTRVGAKGVERIKERMDPDDFQRFEDTRYSV
jgi:hypothetical protein